MDKKLDSRSFTNIFREALPGLVAGIPERAFHYCINNYNKPYLSQEEAFCIEYFTNKYLHSVDYTLIHFAVKVI
jgi:hypothetical protein